MSVLSRSFCLAKIDAAVFYIINSVFEIVRRGRLGAKVRNGFNWHFNVLDPFFM